jgi:very-short-patch-repair endonuclease
MSTTKVARHLRHHPTWAERLLWKWLRDRRFSNYKFRRQHPFGPYTLDFYCLEARLNIELDGHGHGIPNHSIRDKQRDTWLEAHGVKVLRFWNSQLKKEKKIVRHTIWNALQERAAQPVPGYCRSEGNAAGEVEGKKETR